MKPLALAHGAWSTSRNVHNGEQPSTKTYAALMSAGKMDPHSISPRSLEVTSDVLVRLPGRGELLRRVKGLGSGCDGGGVGGAGERGAPHFPSSLVLGRGPSCRFGGCSSRAPTTSTTSGLTVVRTRSMRSNILLEPAVTLRGSSETIRPLETDWRDSGPQ